jgi:hypothetical protein
MRKVLALSLLLLLAGCAKHPPIGKWEGGIVTGGTVVVARVEIGADGLVKVSAPDITGLDPMKPEVMLREREKLQAELVNLWPDVAPRAFDFDGKTFRKPGGQAPQMVWDEKTNQMTVQIFIGRNPALPVALRPVPGFHDNPFGSG